MKGPRGRPSILALALLAMPLFSPAALAARLPDWARTIADGAPPVPEGIPPYPERCLLSEVRYLVQPDGSLQIRRRLAKQVLATRSSRIATGFFHFPETGRFSTSRAWHLPPGERARRGDAAPVDMTLQDTFMSDSKVRAIVMQGIRKGSLVFFEAELTDTPYFISLFHRFYENSPIGLARLEVAAPPGWEVSAEWLKGGGPDPILAGTARSWELTDLPAPEAEPLGPDPVQEAPVLAVHVLPPPGVPTTPAVFADWRSAGAWFDGLANDRREVTPSIREEAEAIQKQVGEDRLGAILAAGLYVRDKVRYVAVELGIGGYQPRPASETLSRLYGDCKDKGTLLQAILAGLEIPSYSVLVNLSMRDTVSESLPVWGFNHLVVAVPIDEGLTLPASMTPAVADAGQLGRLLILDVTDDKTALGSISDALSGKRALLVAGDQSRIIEIPRPGADAHRITRRIVAQLTGEADRSLQRTSTYSGQFGATARSSYGESAIERQRALERKVTGTWPGTTLVGTETDYEGSTGLYVETLTLACLFPACASQPRSLPLFPGASDEIRRVPLGRRTSPVEYDHPFEIRYEVEYAGLPASALPPSARHLDGDGWSVETAHSIEGGTLRSTWEVRLDRTRFGAEAFSELKRFWSAVSSTAGATLPLD